MDDEPLIYEIRIRGHLGSRWSNWFEGLILLPQENGDLLLMGPLADQSALFGVLKKVRDLGMPLLSVSRVEHRQDGPGAIGENKERK